MAATVIILLVVSGVVTLQNLTRMHHAAINLGDSYAVLDSLDSVALALREAETGQRGYLVTGDESYLEPYNAAEAKLDGFLKQLESHTTTNPAQAAVLPTLKQFIESKRGEMVKTIDLQRQGKSNAAEQVVKTDVGKQLMDRIGQQLDLMRNNARVRQSQQLMATNETYRTAWFTGLLLTLLGIALVGGVIWAVFRAQNLKEKNRELDERIHFFLQQISDYAIFMMDSQCRATTWNDGVRQVLGFDEHEFLGRDIRPLIFTPEAHASGTVDAEFEKAVKNDSASDDRWMQRKDGSQFWASGITTSIHDRSGALVGFSKVMRDMTEQKRNSDELSRLAAELSEESRRKNEFLATLAHELRNPLSPIKSAVQLMSMMELSGEVDELRVTMDLQVDQLVRLLDDLMDVSRIGRGKIELKRQAIEMRTIIDSAIENSRALIESNQQELSVDVPEEGLTVHVDPARLTQVICNLLNNASKYSDVNCKIEVIAEHVGEHVVVTVKDNGSGIAPERLSDIFEMFAQIEDSVERGTAGLGIGLTLVRTLVELHGGTVSAHSDGVDQGSEFSIKIPIATVDDSNKAVSPVVDDSKPIQPMRVLVVDDMHALSVILSRLLMKLGHEVEVVDSGLAALAMMERFAADVVFSDISMPGMTGYELAKRLRVEYRSQPLALVAMTGYGQASDRERALAAGFDEHMVKPVDFKLLQAFFQNLQPS
ncbi:hypothetical protein GCM10023156_23810 [Novipirellula rosea]|uniref:histidine kinase n=2 Tax=Novipirellula rosea TaxID=1031540 RepID=A0ABP8MNF9_9BACT